MPNFNIVVAVKDSGREAFKRVREDLNGISKNLKAVSAEILSIGSLATVGLGLSASFVAVGSAAADFEKELSAVAAVVGGLADSDLERLRQKSLELGESTSFSASEVAQGLRILAQAGLSLDEQISAIDSTLNVAAATQISLADAAQITINTVRQFGLDVENDFSRVGDVLVKTTNLAATNIGDLSEAFKLAGPLARSLNLTVEDTAAFLGFFADNGIRATNAGTALKNLLLNSLNPATEETKNLFEALGINEALKPENIEEDSNVLINVIDTLKTSLDGLGNVERAKIIENIFGKIPISAASAAIIEGTEKVRGFTKELQNAEGTAQKVAEIQLDNVVGSFTELTSALSSLAISIGAPFLNFIQTAVDGLTQLTLVVKDFIAENEEITIVIGSVLGGFAAFITISGGLVAAFGVIGFSIVGLTNGLSALSVAIGRNITLLGVLKVALGIGILTALVTLAFQYKEFFALLVDGEKDVKAFGVSVRAVFELGAVRIQEFVINSIIKLEQFIRFVQETQNKIASLGGLVNVQLFDTQDNTEAIKKLEQELVFLEKVRQDINKEIADSAANDTDNSATKLLEESRKNRAAKVELEKSKLELQNSNITSNNRGQNFDLSIAKIETNLAKLQAVSLMSEDKINDIFELRSEKIELGFEKEFEILSQKLEAAIPQQRASIEQEIEILREKREKDVLTLEKQRSDSLERLFENEKQIEDVISRVRLDNIKNQEVVETTRLRNKFAREIEQIENLGATESQVEELKEQQLIQAQELEKSFQQQRVEEERRLNELVLQQRDDLLERSNNAELRRIEERARRERETFESTLQNTILDETQKAEIRLQFEEELRERIARDTEEFRADQERKETEANRRLLEIRAGNASGSEGFSASQELAIQNFISQQQRELEEFKKFTDEKIKIAEFEAEQRTALNNFIVEQQIQGFQRFLSNTQSIAQGTEQIFSELLSGIGSGSKELFFLQKAAASATAAINVAQGVTKALAEGGPILGPVQAGIISVLGALQIAKINAQSFNTGGPVVGRNSQERKKGDNILANVEHGEYVIKSRAVEHYGLPGIDAINNMLLPRDMFKGSLVRKHVARIPKISYNTGGVVSGAGVQNPGSSSSQGITVVNQNIVDPNLIVQTMESQKGDVVIMNSIAKNKNKVQRILGDN